MSASVTVTELWVYPIKSFPGLRVPHLTFDASGPVDDRRWMLVDENGRFVSQRGMPVLAGFAMEERDGRYRVTAPDGEAVELPSPAEEGARLAVSVWKDELQAWEVSPEVSAWFTAKLGKTVHLVHVGKVSERTISDPQAEPHERVGFADGYPLLIGNEASLARLNEVSGLSLDMRRFRPNIVIRGIEDRAELNLGRLEFAEGRVDLLKTCVRCNIPAIDPDTSTYQKEVAAQIKTHCEWDGKTQFGVNGVARGLNRISTGDTARFEPKP